MKTCRNIGLAVALILALTLGLALRAEAARAMFGEAATQTKDLMDVVHFVRKRCGVE